MKNFFKILMVLIVASVALMSFTPSAPADKYPYGKRGTATITYASTINVAPNNLTQLLATCTLTGNVIATVNKDNSIAGDILILKLSASSANRQVDFSTNFTAVDDSVVSGKTKVFEFIFDGTNFVQTGEIQVN